MTENKIMKRSDILKEAKEIVTHDRESQYGAPEDNFQKIAKFWSTYLGTHISATDVANMMVLLKVARSSSGEQKMDNYIDICGYAACGGELASLEKAYSEDSAKDD